MTQIRILGKFIPPPSQINQSYSFNPLSLGNFSSTRVASCGGPFALCFLDRQGVFLKQYMYKPTRNKFYGFNSYPFHG